MTKLIETLEKISLDVYIELGGLNFDEKDFQIALGYELMNIYKFLKRLEPNINGHLLKDIWKFSDREINAEHNFIQVLFPLDEPVTEPPQRLAAELKAKGLSPDFFRSPKPGEVLSLSK